MAPSTPTPRRPTLADVARESGVSVALASIVMRGAEGASEASRTKVKAAALALGYRPDSRARSLRSHHNRTVGVALRLGEPVHAELADALYAEADARGYEIILGAIGGNRDERRVMDTLIDAGAEAIIGISLTLTAAQMAPVASQVPVVSLLRGYRQLPSVLTDEAAGIDELVAHLLHLGHRRLLHLDGGPAVAAAQRRTAFERAVARAAGNVAGTVLGAGPDEATAFDVLDAYLRETAADQRATAVLAFNDRAALGARRAIDLAGLRVPDQIALTGFDDSEFARLAHADLTSVRQDVAALASAALAAATSPGAASSRHAPHLVVRGSSATSKH